MNLFRSLSLQSASRFGEIVVRASEVGRGGYEAKDSRHGVYQIIGHVGFKEAPDVMQILTQCLRKVAEDIFII
jgi:hypothetical protein